LSDSTETRVFLGNYEGATLLAESDRTKYSVLVHQYRQVFGVLERACAFGLGAACCSEEMRAKQALRDESGSKLLRSKRA